MPEYSRSRELQTRNPQVISCVYEYSVSFCRLSYGDNLVAVSMKKRLTLRTTLLISLLTTMPRRNRRCRHDTFTPEVAEEPAEFKRRQDGSSTGAAGCAGCLLPQEMPLRQILYGVVD